MPFAFHRPAGQPPRPDRPADAAAQAGVRPRPAGSDGGASIGEASLEDFLVHWRHAMRGPLNALLAAAAVLENAPEGSDAAHEARQVIARQARTLAWVISERPGEVPRDA